MRVAPRQLGTPHHFQELVSNLRVIMIQSGETEARGDGCVPRSNREGMAKCRIRIEVICQDPWWGALMLLKVHVTVDRHTDIEMSHSEHLLIQL